MRIAMPIWEDRISPVFDTAARLLVFQLDENRETSRFETDLEDLDLNRRCTRILELGVEEVICGAVSQHFYGMLSGLGIEVIPWIRGPVEDVLDAYRRGILLKSDFLMPGRNAGGSSAGPAKIGRAGT